MTKPSVTYDHGFLDDCNDVTDWVEAEVGLTSNLYVENDDVLVIDGTCDNAADEYVTYTKDITNISTDVYPRLLVRWRTSVGANGLQAKIRAIYTAGDTDTTLGFSVTWKTTVINLPAGKTLDKIEIVADDYPNSVAAGTFYVCFDFIMVCKGTFTFPNCAYGMTFNPSPRYVAIPIPSRVGDVTQNLGSPSATLQCSCDLDVGNWKRSGDDVDGAVFMDIAHNSDHECWQWLDTGTEQFKATLDEVTFRREANGSETKNVVDLLFREYRRGNASYESYYERFGLNL